MAGEFQNLTGKKLARSNVTATIGIVYETPANTRAYIKDIIVTNHSCLLYTSPSPRDQA